MRRGKGQLWEVPILHRKQRENRPLYHTQSLKPKPERAALERKQPREGSEIPIVQFPIQKSTGKSNKCAKP